LPNPDWSHNECPLVVKHMKHVLGRSEIVVLPFLGEYLSHRPSRFQGQHKWWISHEEHP
jgi:hypothetical protein